MGNLTVKGLSAQSANCLAMEGSPFLVKSVPTLTFFGEFALCHHGSAVNERTNALKKK